MIRVNKLFTVYHVGDGSGWFRLFGAGIAWKDTTRWALSFSERNGYVKMIRLGKWMLRYLPRS